MKRIIIIIIAVTFILVGCNNDNENPKETHSENNGNNQVVLDNSPDISLEKEPVEEAKTIETFRHRGMEFDIYAEVPRHVPHNSERLVEVDGTGGGKVLFFYDYDILYGEVREFNRDLYGIEFENIQTSEDIMVIIQPYIERFLGSLIVIDGENPYSIEEITLLEENDTKEINGYDFSIQKGLMVIEMSDGSSLDLYFYGYFTLFDDYPLFFMSIAYEASDLNMSVEVLDGIMETFRELRDSDL